MAVESGVLKGGSPRDLEGAESHRRHGECPGGPDPGGAECQAWGQDPAAEPAALAQVAVEAVAPAAVVRPAEGPALAQPGRVAAPPGRSPERRARVMAPAWPEPQHFSQGWAAYRPMDGYRAPAISSAPQHRRRKPSVRPERAGTADGPARSRRPEIPHPRPPYRSRPRP